MPAVRDMEHRRRNPVSLPVLGRTSTHVAANKRRQQLRETRRQEPSVDLDETVKAGKLSLANQLDPPNSPADLKADDDSEDDDDDDDDQKSVNDGPSQDGGVASFSSPARGTVFSTSEGLTQGPVFVFTVDSASDDFTAEWVVASVAPGGLAESIAVFERSMMTPTAGNPPGFRLTLQSNEIENKLLPQHYGRDMYLVLNLQPIPYASSVFSVTTPNMVEVVENGFTARRDVSALGGGASFEGAPWLTRELSSFPGAGDSPGTADDKDPILPTTDSGGRRGGGDRQAIGSGGLSTGAKAGIGVGVGVVALILFGLLAFFLLRNRRRKRGAASAAGAVGYAGAGSLHATPSDFIRDKETHGAHVADSPQSPSDDTRDGALLQAAQSPAVGAAPVAAGAAGAAGAAAQPVQRSGSVAANRPEVPSTVAHLVEEGMSEAEIRRLEEEERALDQAIEQAAQKTSK